MQNFYILFSDSAFSMNIPNLPMQLLAITDSGGANAFFNNDLCQMLITEGNSVADKLRAHFMTSAIGNQLKCKYILSILMYRLIINTKISQKRHKKLYRALVT